MPVPRGIGPLAARAAGASSVHRALTALTRPELELLEALVVLPEPATADDAARAVGAMAAEIAPVLERLHTLALTWGDVELRVVRTVRDTLRSPAGLAPEADDDPSATEAQRRIAEAPPELAPFLARLAHGPSRVDAATGSTAARVLGDAGIIVRRADGLVIPRPVHLALRGGRVRERVALGQPAVTGSPIREQIPGGRDAQTVEAAFEALRILATIGTWREAPPTVLRRGGLPQRELRRLAAQADAPAEALATVVQSAWGDGLVGNDGEHWLPTADFDALAERPDEQRWAELVLAWARGSHLAAHAGTADAQGAPRTLLSSAAARDGVRRRRERVLRTLADAPAVHADAESLIAALAWAFPLTSPSHLEEEVRAALLEGAALGIVLDGALTVPGRALVGVLDADLAHADAELTAALGRLAPPPVDEALLDADLTVTIPGRPSARLQELIAWTEPVSRGGALTLRFTAATVRAALSAGRDADALLTLLREVSRTGIPQALEYLLHDEARRHGQVRVGRAASFLTAEEEVLTLLLASPHAAALQLQRLAPTVAITTAEPGLVLQVVRRSGISGIAVGPDGRPAATERASLTLGGTAVGGTGLAEPDASAGPALRLPPEEVVARIRAADDGSGADLSITDHLLEAIARGQQLVLGIVDGRGGIVQRTAVPLSLEGGRLRARDSRGDDEFTVLVHRVTLG